MKTEQKLYAVIAAVVILGIIIYFVRKDEKKVAEQHSATAAQSLPQVALSKDQIKKITKIEIKNKDKGEVTLVRAEPPPADAKDDEGDAGPKGKKNELRYGTWKLEKPLESEVNQNNVSSMLDNLEKIEVKEVITKQSDQYKRYEVDGEQAIHVVAYQDKDKVLDMWFGKSGSRGQMARVTGTDGVFIAKGYSAHLYTREMKHWRKTDIWSFEDKNAIQVEIANEHGAYSFTKGEKEWAASFAERSGDELGASAAIDKFDSKKLENMLRAFKTLRASDFAEKDAETGLDDPEANGGTVTIKLKDDAGDFQVKVGKKAKNDDRYASREGDENVYVVSSWTAKWAVAEPKEFQEDEDKGKDEDADDEDADDEDADDEDADDKGKGKSKGKRAPKPAPKPKRAPKPAPKGGDDAYE